MYITVPPCIVQFARALRDLKVENCKNKLWEQNESEEWGTEKQLDKRALLSFS